jgi:hypothetical protein
VKEAFEILAELSKPGFASKGTSNILTALFHSHLASASEGMPKK